MLSYRHQFHAGGVADVFKHVVLTRLLVALAQKDKPFFVLDTHAGIGLYDLEHPWSGKTEEWRHGVGRIWARADSPPAMAPYLDALRRENPDGRLRFYPGSPRIAQGLMRAQDRLAMCELNKDDYAALQRAFAGARNTVIQNTDGFAAVRAFLPPKERRGLTFIDAAFDQAQEFDRIVRTVEAALARFGTGMIAIWHPLLDAPAMQAFERSLLSIKPPKTLQLELSFRPETWTEY